MCIFITMNKDIIIIFIIIIITIIDIIIITTTITLQKRLVRFQCNCAFKTFFLSMKLVFLTLLYFFWKRFYKNGDTSISCDIYDL